MPFWMAWAGLELPFVLAFAIYAGHENINVVSLLIVIIAVTLLWNLAPRWFFPRPRPWEKKYETAHPESDNGDPNEADRRGLTLVAIRPDGLLVYRRRHWWVRGGG